MQRIRIGLTGLAFVFLLVLLGTAIGTSREDVEALSNGDLSVLTNNAEPAEPLAELGAAPGQAASEEANETNPDPALDGDATDVVVDEISRPLDGQ